VSSFLTAHQHRKAI